MKALLRIGLYTLFIAPVGAYAQLQISIQMDSGPILSVSGPRGTVCQAQWTVEPMSTTQWFHLGYAVLPDGSGKVHDSLWASNSLRFYRVVQVPNTNVALVPAGVFLMGDTFAEGNPKELPVHSVLVRAFYMDRFEVTKQLWDEVYEWAVTNGYAFSYAAAGKLAGHPAQDMTWHDAVKWCNARSEKGGLVPAYYTNPNQTEPYRTGWVDVRNDWVKWNSGYRLPTEAEWEKAARGGSTARRFPWVDTDIITHSKANYYSVSTNSHPSYPYDVSSTIGHHPAFNDGIEPYTSPVGHFAPNNYGLCDMAGNVWEWCWDWNSIDYYGSSPEIDPRGPSSGQFRVIRGGGWNYNASVCRAADRNSIWQGESEPYVGFRCVLPLGKR